MNPDPWQIRPVSGGSTRTNSKSTETVDQKQHEFSAAALHFARCKSFKAGRAIRPAIPSRGGYGHIPKSISCWHHSTLKAFSPAIPSCGGMARIPNQSIYRWHHSKLISAQPFHHAAAMARSQKHLAGTIRQSFHSIMAMAMFPKASILLAPFAQTFSPAIPSCGGYGHSQKQLLLAPVP